jgi:glycosyltransferase involved in cell wall biosynthesis
MRILYHHRTLGDGAEGIHIAEMVRAFRALGHEVRVLGPAAAGPASSTRAARVKAWLPGLVFEAASVALNGPEYLAMRREIAAWQPDLVYKRHARYDVGPVLAARRAGVPVILEVNAVYCARPYRDFEPQNLHPIAERLERAALRAATVVYAVSSPMAAQVEALSGRPCLTIPNGADADAFAPARVQPVVGPWTGPDTLVVGWTGGLREWHGLDLLVDAFTRLPERARLLLVGDGPLRVQVECQARERGVADRVFVTGRVDRNALPGYVAAMDIGVVADERTAVASPMKLLEYMAAGKAVVAPDLPNLRDVVTPGTNGMLFDAGSAEALAGALAQLAAAPLLREQLGTAARAYVIGRGNWRAIAEQVIAISAR